MNKPKIKYDIRRSVMDGHEYTYPAIVEREATLTLKDVIEHAIDTGRIVGLKGTAAETIEQAVLLQIDAELEAGNSVKFEDYFRIQLYLDGQTDANGTLTDENKIVPRFINGSQLGITRELYTLEYADGAECPNVTEVKSANNAVPDWTVQGQDDVLVMGTHFTTGNPAEELAVVFAPENGGEEVRVPEMVTTAPDVLRIHRPAGLEVGKYKVRVERTDGDSSKVYPSNGKTVTVADNTPPAPVNPEFTSVTMGEFPENEVDFDDHTPLVFHGTNLAYNAGDTLKIELRPDKGEATAVLDELKSISASADGTTLSCINEVNTSGKPDGSWWGRDALVTLTTGGKTASLWVKFHDWS